MSRYQSQLERVQKDPAFQKGMHKGILLSIFLFMIGCGDSSRQPTCVLPSPAVTWQEVDLGWAMTAMPPTFAEGLQERHERHGTTWFSEHATGSLEASTIHALYKSSWMPPVKDGTVDYHRCRSVQRDHVLEMATYRYVDRPDTYITESVWLPLPVAGDPPQQPFGSLYIESHSTDEKQDALKIVASLRPRVLDL